MIPAFSVLTADFLKISGLFLMSNDLFYIQPVRLFAV